MQEAAVVGSSGEAAVQAAGPGPPVVGGEASHVVEGATCPATNVNSDWSLSVRSIFALWSARVAGSGADALGPDAGPQTA